MKLKRAKRSNQTAQRTSFKKKACEGTLGCGCWLGEWGWQQRGQQQSELWLPTALKEQSLNGKLASPGQRGKSEHAWHNRACHTHAKYTAPAITVDKINISHYVPLAGSYSRLTSSMTDCWRFVTGERLSSFHGDRSQSLKTPEIFCR